MHLHEYQAKQLLMRYGLPTPAFFVASNLEELKKGLDSLPTEESVLKIQVHAGGRGKGGGVKFAKTKKEALEIGKSLLGFRLINEQTGSQGAIAEKVLVSAPIQIEHESYLALLIDRKSRTLTFIVSPEGGMEIEEVAKTHPDKIMTVKVLPSGRLPAFQVAKISNLMGWNEELRKEGEVLLKNLIQAFLESDASLLEINPLVTTKEGKLTVLDAKMTVDDNALFRQSLLKDQEDLNQLAKAERMAREADLSYVALEGNIGCMVNGAGLAMATMDIIHYYGGMPANFLDVGGSATEEKITEGFNIILSDPNIKAILVNIFGGIMNCATIAVGLIAGVKKLGLNVPLVVRMEGTNVEQGKAALHESKLPFILCSTLEEAAEKAVNAAKGQR